MADQGEQVALTLHFQSKDEEPALFVMVRDALNESGEVVKFGEEEIGMTNIGRSGD